jgi:cell division protein FtsQ
VPPSAKDASAIESPPRAADAGARKSRGGLVTRRMKLAFGGILLLLVVGSPFWAPLVLRRMAFFRVRRVEIVGAHYVAASEILARLRVDTTISIWDPTGPLEARAREHAEVAQAVVRRKLPGTLVVELTERVPVALVPTNTGFRAYDALGNALPIDLTRVAVDAPIASQRDTAVLRLLGTMRMEMPAMYARLSAISPVGVDELRIELQSHVVRAMKDVTLERLADIDPVEADLERKQLRAAEIDLRYRDQVIARLP